MSNLEKAISDINELHNLSKVKYELYMKLASLDNNSLYNSNEYKDMIDYINTIGKMEYKLCSKIPNDKKDFYIRVAYDEYSDILDDQECDCIFYNKKDTIIASRTINYLYKSFIDNCLTNGVHDNIEMMSLAKTLNTYAHNGVFIKEIEKAVKNTDDLKLKELLNNAKYQIIYSFDILENKAIQNNFDFSEFNGQYSESLLKFYGVESIYDKLSEQYNYQNIINQMNLMITMPDNYYNIVENKRMTALRKCYLNSSLVNYQNVDNISEINYQFHNNIDTPNGQLIYKNHQLVIDDICDSFKELKKITK